MDGKRKKKPTRRDNRNRGPKSRILNRKNDRRSKAPMNESKSDESGDEVNFVVIIVNCYVTGYLHEFAANSMSCNAVKNFDVL